MDQQKLNQNEYLTLTQAAKRAPGRPSPSCLWRWCRDGVKAKTGERVRLMHTRFGGRIFTTVEWLDAFGQELAAADAKHFERRRETADRCRDEPRSRRGGRRDSEKRMRDRHECAARELEAKGL